MEFEQPFALHSYTLSDHLIRYTCEMQSSTTVLPKHLSVQVYLILSVDA